METSMGIYDTFHNHWNGFLTPKTCIKMKMPRRFVLSVVKFSSKGGSEVNVVHSILEFSGLLLLWCCHKEWMSRLSNHLYAAWHTLVANFRPNFEETHFAGVEVTTALLGRKRPSSCQRISDLFLLAEVPVWSTVRSKDRQATSCTWPRSETVSRMLWRLGQLLQNVQHSFLWANGKRTSIARKMQPFEKWMARSAACCAQKKLSGSRSPRWESDVHTDASSAHCNQRAIPGDFVEYATHVRFSFWKISFFICVSHFVKTKLLIKTLHSRIRMLTAPMWSQHHHKTILIHFFMVSPS